jgi:small subunit ribosomal protein S16
MGSTASSPPGAPAARHRNFWEKTAPVAVKIKLKRLGKIRAPYYRIVVADSRTKRDGRAIEEIGKYHPKAEPSFIEVDSDRAQHWLSVGAQPTDPVRKIFEITGDWQKFKGLPGTEGTLQTAAAKEDRKEVFAAAVRETLGETAASTKGKGRSGGAAKEAGQTRAEKPARKARETGAAAKHDAKDDAAAAKHDAKGDAAAAKHDAKDDAAAEPKAADVTADAEPAGSG